MIGEVIDGKYKITRLIGEGGMGAVYEGENILISRRVAIKVLHAAMALNQQTVERFQREARAAGRIGNDHILEVLDLGRLSNGDYFMVMEYLDGETLSARIQRFGRMTPEQLGPLITQVLAGLAAAHTAGIVHRDLKPDNIFILSHKAGHRDFVKIIDFGISKFSPLSGDDSAKKMTQTGAIMGTPYYMSPEQARGSLDADARADLYSVGVMMYEAVSSQVPFDGRTINELMFNIALNDPKPLRSLATDIDPDFEQIIVKAMAKDRDHRYQTADEFLTALSAWQKPGQSHVSMMQPAVQARGYTGSMPQVIEPNQVGALTQGTPAPKAVTTNTWARSQADEAPPAIPKSSSGLLVAAALGGLVLLGGGGLAVYKLTGSDATPASGSSATPPEPPPSAEAPVETTAPSVTPQPAPTGTVDKPGPSVAPVPQPAPTPSSTATKPPAPAVGPAPSPRPRPPSKPPARPAKPPEKPAPPVVESKPPTPPTKRPALQFGY